MKKKLNKGIKEVRLLYRASRDGDSTQFHKKCDGVTNTVTFVKAKNGRKFGGFANKGWDSSNHYIGDDKAFLFSYYYYECYFYNSGNNWIYGSSSYGPLWGFGHDLYLASGCLSNNSSNTNQSGSYNYNGKNDALNGGSNFQAEDYETYELILQYIIYFLFCNTIVLFFVFYFKYYWGWRLRIGPIPQSQQNTLIIIKNVKVDNYVYWILKF